MPHRCHGHCHHYGCLNFLLDLFLIGITGGLWIIWIIFRELRRTSY